MLRIGLQKSIFPPLNACKYRQDLCTDMTTRVSEYWDDLTRECHRGMCCDNSNYSRCNVPTNCPKSVLNQRPVKMKQVQHQPVQAYRHRFVHLKFGPGCSLHFSSIFCSNALSLGLKILDLHGIECKAVLPGSGLFETPFPRSIRLNIP